MVPGDDSITRSRSLKNILPDILPLHAGGISLIIIKLEMIRLRDFLNHPVMSETLSNGEMKNRVRRDEHHIEHQMLIYE